MSVSLEPGDVLGRFRVEGLIGAGGMGAVYKIRDPKSKMPFAAKVLYPALTREKDFVRRFRREAKIARRLKHMNVVHVFKLRHWRRTLFYVMEFVEGSPLDELMASREEFTFDRSIALMRETAAGLGYVHSKHYVHRDVKGDNILIRGDGHLKIADFGLAQRFGRAKRTKSGHIMGTAKYMAPELIEGAYVYPQTDIYSLGCLTYELVAGRPPFEADHGEVYMDLHLYGHHKPLMDVVEGIDRNFSLFVDKMLAKSVTHRVPSARMVHSYFDYYLTRGQFADLPRRLRDY